MIRQDKSLFDSFSLNLCIKISLFAYVNMSMQHLVKVCTFGVHTKVCKVYFILWTVTYLLDKVIYSLSNWGLVLY